MNYRNAIKSAACIALVAVTGYACGNVESKPPNASANVTTGNNSANNSTAECTLDLDCVAGESCVDGQCLVGCLLDTDCVAPDICENSVCLPSCATDADCAVGEVCGPRINGPGNFCVTDSANNVSNNGCADEADPNAFCEAQFGSGAFCDTTSGDCVGGANNLADPVFVAQIQDVTTQAEACEDVFDPGSDIQGVELQDSVGNSLGWGNIVAENVILDGNDEFNFAVIDGTPPALDADGCVDSFSGNVLALGCTGWVAVEFLDEGGNPIALQNGQSILVYEYGGVCSTGTLDDEYVVALCTDTAGISGGDDSACTNVLGSGGGVASFSVRVN